MAKGEMIMLVIHDLRLWLYRARKNWDLSAGENGNQIGDWGSEVFSEIFKSLLQVIGGMEVPANRPGVYVCDVHPELKIVWFEPAEKGCCPTGYDVCHLTHSEVRGAENLEQLWKLFISKFVQGLANLEKSMAKEIATCVSRSKNWRLAKDELNRL